MKVWAAAGIPAAEICKVVKNPKTGKGIGLATLYKHFRTELEEGHVEANAKVVASLFKNATTPTENHPGGLPVAQLFWLKCRLRWQQNPERNPPPPAAPKDVLDADPVDTGRRLAFMLARTAHETGKKKHTG